MKIIVSFTNSVVAVFALVLWIASASAAQHTPPPKPSVAPSISRDYPNDKNKDRIADGLKDKADTARTGAEQTRMVQVELVFTEQITQEQIDTFERAGGAIDHIFQTVSYGWNGRVPLNKVTALPHLLGGSLTLVDEPTPIQLYLDRATQTARVRPVWVSGAPFYGNRGSTNITIGIIDSGVDGSHTDLSGRNVYWKDYTSDAHASAVDYGGHGTMVASIALGTGAAGKTNATTLSYTTFGTATTDGSFYGYPFDFSDTASHELSGTATWDGGGQGRLEICRRLKNTSGTISVLQGFLNRSSPNSNSVTVTGTNRYDFYIGVTGTNIGNFVIAQKITNYPGVGDGFATMSGVAPLCNYAMAKVFKDDGTGGDTATLSSALDDLVSRRTTDKTKVINMSLGGGTSSTLRQKVNTAVGNGIVVVAAAGNDGLSAGYIGDPGTAAMAITVAACSDTNQLTDYSSRGFASISSDQDYKPDIMAPGGSDYQRAIFAADSNSGDSTHFSDQQSNDYGLFEGTSCATPFVSGASALVINAMEQSGATWDFTSSTQPRFVKMLLLATATESNQGREGGFYSPTLERNSAGPSNYPVGKDPYEGYGMLNADAAVQAVRETVDLVRSSFVTNITIGTSNNFASDKRVWAVKVNLASEIPKAFAISKPGTGLFDLYLYSTNSSDSGTPVLLGSVKGDDTVPFGALFPTFTYRPSATETALLVAKRVSGYGSPSVYMFAVSNDNFTNAQTIYNTSGTASGSISDGSGGGNSAEAGEPSHQGYPATASGWWKWTAPQAGAATFTATSTSFTPCMGVYTGTSVSNLTQATIISNNVLGKTVFRANAGTTYYIAVDYVPGSTIYPTDYTLTWSFNVAPTLSGVSTLTNAFEDTPFTINYTNLLAAATVSDPDSSAISFRVEYVYAVSGTLKKNGTNVVPGSTLLSTNESWVWTPTTNFSGTPFMFTVSAYDGLSFSANSYLVQASVAAVNDAPTLTAISTIPFAVEDTAFSISYTTLTNSSDIADIDSSTLWFRVETINGTLTKNGTNVVVGSTLLGSGENFTWTPPTNANGATTGFTVKAWDGALASDTAIPVTVSVSARNDAPVVANPINSLSATYGTAFTYTFPSDTFTDIDSATLTYSATGLPTGISFTSGTRTFSGTPTQLGTNTVKLFASDGAGGQASNSFPFVVGKAPLSAKANDASRTYGSTNPTFTGSITGVVNSDNVTASYSASTTTNSTAGTYTITVSLSDPSSRLTNYTSSLTNGTLTIGKAGLTVSSVSASRAYGSSNPSFTATYTGFVNGQTRATSDLAGSPGFTTSADTNGTVGSYSVVGSVNSLTSTNYSFTFSNGSLSVTSAPLSIIVSNATRAYGATNPAFNGSITGLRNNDNITATYTTTATSSSPVGTYPITSALVDPNARLGNYSVTTNVGTLTITSNSLPVVAFVTPTTNDTISAGGTTTVTVTATDPDGSISKVEFYEGTTKFGTVTNSPYTATWTNTFAGTFTLTATATDNANATKSVSLPILVYMALRNPIMTSSNFTATFYGIQNEYYIAQYSTNLINWTNLPGVQVNGPVTITDTNISSQRFYRVIIDL